MFIDRNCVEICNCFRRRRSKFWLFILFILRAAGCR